MQQKKLNIKSWCQKVLDLLDLTFAELFVILWNYVEHLETGLLVNYHNYPGLSKCFDGNSDNHHFSSNKEGKLVDFMEYS